MTISQWKHLHLNLIEFNIIQRPIPLCICCKREKSIEWRILQYLQFSLSSEKNRRIHLSEKEKQLNFCRARLSWVRDGPIRQHWSEQSIFKVKFNKLKIAHFTLTFFSCRYFFRLLADLLRLFSFHSRFCCFPVSSGN